MKALWIGGPDSRIVKNIFSELAANDVIVDAHWQSIGGKMHLPTWVDVVIVNEEACDRGDKDVAKKMAENASIPFVWGSVKGSKVVERLREKGLITTPAPATTLLPSNDREQFNNPKTVLKADDTLFLDGIVGKPVIVDNELFVDTANATLCKGMDVWKIARTRRATRSEILAYMPNITPEVLTPQQQIAVVEALVAAPVTSPKVTLVSYGDGMPALIDAVGRRIRPVKSADGVLEDFEALAAKYPDAEWVESPLQVHAILDGGEHVELRASVDGRVKRVKPLFVNDVYYDTQSEAAEATGIQQGELSRVFRKGEGIATGGKRVRAAKLEEVRRMYPKAQVTAADDESPEPASVVNVILADHDPPRVRTLTSNQPQVPVIVDGHVYANAELASRDYPLVRDAVRYLRSGKRSYNGHSLAWPTLDDLKRTWPGAHVVHTEPGTPPRQQSVTTGTKVFKAQVLPTGQVLVVPLSPRAQLFDSREAMPQGIAELCEWDS